MYPQQGYGAPMGQPGYGAPMMGQPGYGAPIMAQPGYSTTTTTMVSVPQAWNRVSYQYSGYYDPRVAFMPPSGVSPQDAQLMMTASSIFRTFVFSLKQP